jgi:hypothetical protein
MYHLKSFDTLDLPIFLTRQRLEVKVKAAAEVNTFCEGGLLAFRSVIARNAGNREDDLNAEAGKLRYCVIKSKAEVSRGVKRVTVRC